MLAIAREVRRMWNKRTKPRRRKAERRLFLERLERREVFAALPVGIDDLTYSTALNTAITVNAANGVLGNDFQVDGNSLTATLVGSATGGTVTSLGSDGSFTFTPTSGFSGVASFTYRVDSGSDQGNVTTVGIAVDRKFSARTNTDVLSQNGALLDGANVIHQQLPQGVDLVYRSDTSKIKPIVAVETTLLSSAGVPDSIEAQLTFNGVAQGLVTYNNTGLSAGTPLRFALAADGTGLSTGMYDWSMTITAKYGGTSYVHTFTGKQAVINRTGSEFGNGWSVNGLDKLVTSSAGALLVKGNGDILWFESNGAGGYKSAAGDVSNSSLTYNSGTGVYTRTARSGDVQTFDSSGNLASLKDANNNTTTFSYSSGKLTSITDPFSRVTSFTLSSGKVTSITDFAGRSSALTFTGDKLTQFDLPDPDGTGSATSPQWKYAYDGSTGLLNKQTDPRANDITFAYNSTSSRLTTVTHPGSITEQVDAWLPMGLRTGTGNTVTKIVDVRPSFTDVRGFQWWVQLDRFGNIRQTKDPYNTITTSSLDSNGRVFQVVSSDPDGAGPLTSPVKKFGFNSSGDVIRIVNEDNSTTNFTYNSLGKVLTATDELGRGRTMTYDSVGNTLTNTDNAGNATTFTYNSRGQMLTQTTADPDGAGSQTAQVITCTYDSYGRLSTITEPGSATTTLTYTSSDCIATVTDQLGHVTSMSYDNLDRVTVITQPDPDGAGSLTSPTRTYSYDASGNRTVIADSFGNQTTFNYDAFNHLSKITTADPDGAGSLVAIETNFTYDAAGNLSTSTTPSTGGTNAGGGGGIAVCPGFNGQLSICGLPTIGFGASTSTSSSSVSSGGGNNPMVVYSAVMSTIQSASMAPPFPTATNITYNYSRDAYGRELTRTKKQGGTTIETESTTYDTLGRMTSLTDKLGRKQTWTYDSRGRIIEYVDNAPVSGSPAKTLYTYDAAGQMTSKTDFRGYTTTYAYDSVGRLTKVTLPDPDGSGQSYSPVIQYGYDNLGRQTTVTDPLGRVTTTAYNDRNWITSVTSPDPDGAGSATAPVTSYTYFANGLINTVTDPLGRVTTTTYDNLDRPITVTYADPDGAGSLTSPVESWTYDSEGNILTHTDALGNVTTNTYDNLFRIKTVTGADPDGAGSLTAPVTTYTYSSAGVLSKVTDPLGRDTTYGYDSFNRRTTVTDPLGNVTTTAYNSAGLVASVTTPDPDGAGSLTASTTSYTYDVFGRQLTATDANSGVTTSTYDTMGNVTSIKDPLNNTTSWTYDGLGRVTSETNQLNKTEYYYYDVAGNLARVNNRNGNSIQYTYDDLDRLLTEKWYDGAATAPTANAATTVQGSGPTNEVQQVGFTSGFGTLAGSFTLSFNGQTTSTLTWNASASAVQSALTTLSNIGSGNLAVTKTSDTSSSQIWQLAFQGSLAGTNVSQVTVNSSVTSMGFPATVQQTTTTQGGGGTNEQQTLTVSNATGGTFRLAYNNVQTAAIAYNASASTVQSALQGILGSGNVTVSGSAGSYTVTFTGTFASTNVLQLCSDSSQLQNGTLNRTLTYAYDAASQVTSASDSAATYTYNYDNLGRVTSTTQTIAGLTPTITYSQAFNASSDRTQIAATIGSMADFKNTFSYDNLHRLTSLQQETQSGGNAVATKLVDFAYNKLNQFTTIDRYQNTGRTNIAAQTTFTYDSGNRLSTLNHKQGSTTLAGYTYGYDNASRITSINSVTDGNDTFTHDKNNQVTGADYASQTDESFTYDANGNRTGGGYTVTTNNRTTSDGTYTYTYDDEGNRLTRTKISDSSKEEYTWDFRNRLTGVTYKNSSGTVLKTVAYAYDVYNQLVRRTYDADGPGSGAAVDRFFSNLDGQVQLQFEGAAASTLSHRYLWGPQGDQLLADENVTSLSTAGNILWALSDRVGTIRDIADQNESTNTTTVTNHRVFNAFGSLVSQTNSSVGEMFGYTGKMRDDVTALQNNLNRWYDASLGQWLSEDPIGFSGGDPNLRRYVGNAALSSTDSNGLAVDESGYDDSIVYEVGGQQVMHISGSNDGFGYWTPIGGSTAKTVHLDKFETHFKVSTGFSFDPLDAAANVSAGFGDTISFGATRYIRKGMGIDGGIDDESWAYFGGECGGMVWQLVFSIATGNPCAVNAAPMWARNIAMAYNTVSNYEFVLDAAEYGYNRYYNWDQPFGYQDVADIAGIIASSPLLGKIGEMIPGCFAAGTLVHLSAVPAAERDSRIGLDLLAETHLGMNGGSDRSITDRALATIESIKVPIEQVALGSRVSTKNPRPEEYDFTFPEPVQKDWLKISARIRRADNALVDIEWLRPAAWVREKNLAPGSSLNIQLPELDLDGPGVVLAIDECPAIADGDGSVVTGRVVTRDSTELVNVTFDDGEVLTGTAIHPIWSLSKQDWVPLGELQPWELVACESGSAVVCDVERLGITAPVYNIEVHGEHVYEVGEAGWLVHNAGSCSQNAKELAESLANNVSARPAGAHAGHIIPSKDLWLSRGDDVNDAIKYGHDALAAAGISVNSYLNGFWASGRGHNGTHTNAFLLDMGKMMNGLTQYQDVVDALDKLRKRWNL